MTAGLILADAAIYDQKKVVQTQSYGAEARGGASRSDVIVSDEEITFPKPDYLDVLVAMNQISVDKYVSALADTGKLIADATFVHTTTFPESYLIPFTALARENFKQELVANVIALGALIELTGVVSKPAAERALEARVPKSFVDMNRRALELGITAGREAAAARASAEGGFNIV